MISAPECILITCNCNGATDELIPEVLVAAVGSRCVSTATLPSQWAYFIERAGPWLPWELIRFLQFEIWPYSVIEIQMSGASQWRQKADRGEFRNEEKKKKRTKEKTRENLEKGMQKKKKKNHGRTFPLPSIWCQICYPKAVCGRSFAGIAVSNHAEGMMFVCCVLCRYRPMHEADHCSVESYRVSVCACDLETSTA
jgi:hypothetical protein